MAVKSKSDTSILDKIKDAREAMKDAIVEKDEEIDCMFTAIFAAEHALFVGPPGTAKSFMIDSLTKGWIDEEDTLFSYLLTKFTDPDEIFGPTNIPALADEDNPRLERLLNGFIVGSSFAFLDEIYKASSAILNTLLKLINERMFTYGLQTQKANLISLFAASNEFPDGENQGVELGALSDRFLIKKIVQPVRSEAGRSKLLWGAKNDDHTPEFRTRANLQDIKSGIQMAKKLEFADASKNVFEEILKELNGAGIFPGDRKLLKSKKACRAYAFINGSEDVQPEHLEILAHVLWDDPNEQPAKVAKIVAEKANPTAFIVSQKLSEAEDVMRNSTPADAVPKLKNIRTELQKLKEDNRRNKALNYLSDCIKKFYNQVIGVVEE